jgi:putative phosphoesterase
MNIGVASDTHRNKENLNRVVEWLISNHHIVGLYHLGDDYEDVVDLVDEGIEIVQVPGIYHQRYYDGTLEKKHVENILGLRIVLVHSLEKDITEDDRTVTDIILYGHTHRPELKLVDGLLLMNPGHLKADIDKTVKPSFGLLDIQDQSATASIFNLDYKEINSVKLMRTESGLFRSS